MRGLGRWLREDPDRFPMVVGILSTGGLTSIFLGTIFGPALWRTGFSTGAFLILLLLILACAWGGSH